MPTLESLMSGGYELDYGDIDSNWVPDIDSQFVVEYQNDGDVYKNVFTVFEGDNEKHVFAKALDFAKTHDTLVFYQEVCTKFFHPITGKKVETPDCGPYCKHYYDQPEQPYQARKDGFIAIESDELPF